MPPTTTTRAATARVRTTGGGENERHFQRVYATRQHKSSTMIDIIVNVCYATNRLPRPPGFPVILSGVSPLACERIGGVEGSLSPMPSPGRYAVPIAILRLRDCFAKRSSPSAQDDKAEPARHHDPRRPGRPRPGRRAQLANAFRLKELSPPGPRQQRPRLFKLRQPSRRNFQMNRRRLIIPALQQA
jgi:hypothetical protein